MKRSRPTLEKPKSKLSKIPLSTYEFNENALNTILNKLENLEIKMSKVDVKNRFDKLINKLEQTNIDTTNIKSRVDTIYQSLPTKKSKLSKTQIYNRLDTLTSLDPSPISVQYKLNLYPDTLFIFYLLSKYSNICSTINYNIGYKEFLEPNKIYWTCDVNNERTLEYDDEILSGIKNCINGFNPFTVILLELSQTGPCIDKNEDTSHANILIIDNITKEVERYEPHGQSADFFDIISLDTDLTEFFSDFNLSYIPPLNYCPIKGLQSLEVEESEELGIESEGYCLSWSIFWAELRLSLPELSRSQIIDLDIEDYLIDKFGNLPSFITSYASMISNWALPFLTDFINHSDLKSRILFNGFDFPSYKLPDYLYNHSYLLPLFNNNGFYSFKPTTFSNNQLLIYDSYYDSSPSFVYSLYSIPDFKIGFIRYDLFSRKSNDYFVTKIINLKPFTFSLD